jgi:tetratricopeptide (TPR) repeat protein
MLEDLLAELQARLSRFAVDQDADGVLSEDALALVDQLMREEADSGTKLKVMHAAGWLHWYRYLVPGRGEDQRDLAAALTLLAPVYRVQPEAVPNQVRSYFDDHQPADPDSPEAMGSRAMQLLQRALSTDDPAALDTGIDLLQTLAARADDRNHAAVLSNLCAALRIRFERTGELADLNLAVAVGEQAVAATLTDDPGLGAALANLAAALQRRFERTGALADLDHAVDLDEQALAATPSGNPDRAGILSNLGSILRTRFERAGDAADVNQAVAVSRQALDSIHADDPRRAVYLSNLCAALRIRAERGGEPADLNSAVEFGRQAVDASPTDDPELGTTLAQLGHALRDRFERTGELADLDEAVDVFRRVVAATAASRPHWGGELSNLSLALQSRFQRTQVLTDIDEAVEVGERAVAATPAGHPDWHRRLSILSTALQRRFERTGNLTDLDHAISDGERAVAATPDNHPDLAVYLSNLGGNLRSRFERSGLLLDLDKAIDATRQAVAATPADQPYRATYLLNLGSTLRTRFARTQALPDLDEAIDVSQRAVAIDTAPAIVRARAAGQWGLLAAATQNWAQAVEGYSAAVGLVALAAPRSLSRRDQEHNLTELAGLGSQAVACCLEAGEVDRAVELWEQARAVLLSQSLDIRTDLTMLTAAQPQLAQKFIDLRDEFERPANLIGVNPEGSDAAMRLARADRRREAAALLEQIIVEIRTIPGSENFLLPLPIEELLPAAESGPVVLVNISDIRSDALILTAAGIQVLPLSEPMRSPTLDQALQDNSRSTGLQPQAIHTLGNARTANKTRLSSKTVSARVMEYVTALEEITTAPAARDAADRAEAQLRSVLGWLWDVIAEPVLFELGITVRPGDEQPWPRIWWCPGGLLSLLPLHAAGHHHTRFDATPQTVIDRVISSYTPTVRALLRARRAVPVTRQLAGRILVVAMPHTPGAPDLPGAPKECAALRARFGHDMLALIGPEERGSHEHSGGSRLPTNQSVSAAMPLYEWAHFACHATNRLDDPSASCLLLDDYTDQPLNVLSVAQLSLEHAELAFLSACSTARTGTALPDEAINLASAFQLAGYRRVVATLWPVEDRLAVRLAENFYETLTSTGKTDFAASALHRATRRLRATHADQPSMWAAHMHSGI